MFSNYFDPVSQDVVDFKSQLNRHSLGSHIECYHGDFFPNIDSSDIALIIVPENRGRVKKMPTSSYSQFRKAFYGLFKGDWEYRIVDFGNLKPGSELKDTYFALNDIIWRNLQRADKKGVLSRVTFDEFVSFVSFQDPVKY